MAAAAHERRDGRKLFLPIVLNRGALLNQELRNAIVMFFAQEQLDGYLVWIDDLNETEAAGETLLALLDLTRRLRRRFAILRRKVPGISR